MTTALQPFVNGRFQAFDSNGNPLSGGLLYTYLAGTSTPQSTYTDSAGGVANANPVVLDANGEADVWLTTTANYKFVLKDSSGVIQWTVDNWPPGGSGSSSAANPEDFDPGGRLSLTSGTPVDTGDVTAATTVYYVPYKSDKVPLYDGTAWALYSIGAGISQATTDNTKSPAAVVLNSVYDLFVWNDNGTVRLSRGYVWFGPTSRGSGVGTAELTQQNGKWVNKQAITNGPAANRGLYVGTIYADSNAQLDDSSTGQRYVWNAYNRVARSMRVISAAGNHTYTTATWREVGASATNQLGFVIGLSEDAVSAEAGAIGQNSADDGYLYTGIGLDSTSGPVSGSLVLHAYVSGVIRFSHASASWRGLPGIGYHYLAWLEYSGIVTSTTTWLGTTSSAPAVTGIQGEVRA